MVGYYAPGGTHDDCAPCGDGYTTASDGTGPFTDCLIAPGYGYVAGFDPEPCAQGSFGAGGTNNMACSPCASHATTTGNFLATSQGDCTLCAAGYGINGGGCQMCTWNTFSRGDSTTCSSCVSDTQAPPGSSSSDFCVPAWTPWTTPQNVDSIAIDVTASYVNALNMTLFPTVADCKTAW